MFEKRYHDIKLLNIYIIENIILIKVDMVHDLLVRGFDDKIHSQLGEFS